jgi:hypothetical protein
MQKQNSQFQAIPNWPLSGSRLPASASPVTPFPENRCFQINNHGRVLRQNCMASRKANNSNNLNYPQH